MDKGIYTEEDINPIASESEEPKTYIENEKLPERKYKPNLGDYDGMKVEKQAIKKPTKDGTYNDIHKALFYAEDDMSEDDFAELLILLHNLVGRKLLTRSTRIQQLITLGKIKEQEVSKPEGV